MRSFLSRLRRPPWAPEPQRQSVDIAPSVGQRQAPPARGQAEIHALLNSDPDSNESELQNFVQVIERARNRHEVGNTRVNNIDSGSGMRRSFGYVDDEDSFNLLSPPSSLLLETFPPQASSSPNNGSSGLYLPANNSQSSQGSYRPRQWELIRNMMAAVVEEYDSDDFPQNSVVFDDHYDTPRSPFHYDPVVDAWLDTLKEPSGSPSWSVPDDDDNNNNNISPGEDPDPSNSLGDWHAYSDYYYEVASQAESAGEGPSRPPAQWPGQNNTTTNNNNPEGQSYCRDDSIPMDMFNPDRRPSQSLFGPPSQSNTRGYFWRLHMESQASAGEGPSDQPGTGPGLQHPELDTSALSFSVGGSGYFSVGHLPGPSAFASPASSPTSSYHSSSSEPSLPELILRDLREEEQAGNEEQDDE